MSNISSDSQVFWVHGFTTLVITLFAILLQFWNYSYYYSTRTRYRTIPTVDHCSVMAVNLQEKDLVGETIQEKSLNLKNKYNEKFQNTVFSLQLVREDEELKSLVEKHQEEKKKLENSMDYKELGEPKTVRPGICCTGEKQDAVTYYSQRVNELQ